MTAELFFNFFLAGLVIGGIYGLISIGLNLQYGVARVLNLAYGEFLMLAGYAAFWGFTLLNLSPLVTVLVGVPAAFVGSWLLFVYVLHPLLSRTNNPGKREVDSLLSSFGLLFILQGVALVLWGATDRSFSYLSEPVHLYGATITGNRLVALVAAILLAFGVYIALRRSKTGRALRSLASNPAASPLVGVDVVRYSAIAFASGGALAAIAGILLSAFIGINPTIGGVYTIKALIVVTMGGIGHVLGGLLAGFLLGMAETFGAMLLDPGLITAISFALFAAVLLWRPQGLLGGSSRSSGSGRSLFRSWSLSTALPLALLVALALAPLFLATYWLSLMVNILTYTALATGWAFFSGPTRYISLAASAFFGLGAYTIAVLADPIGYWPALAAAGAVGIVVAAVVGLTTLRLRGMYFVIFTFGLAALIREIVTWWEFKIAQKAGRHIFLNITTVDIYYQLLVLCAVIFGLWMWRDRSRMGYALKTLGANETVARQIGINTTALKIGTFIVSSLVMTLAGAILAPRWSYMDTTVAFNANTSFLTVIMALLGGANSVWGPVLGVVPLVIVSDFLSVTVPSYFSVVLGLCFLAIVFYMPDGVLGLLQAWWRRFQKLRGERSK
jgi:branched-chain amino acid transport system permease protein